MEDPLESPYRERRRRAIELLGTRLAAEELLGFLVGLTELQAPIYDRAAERRAAAAAIDPAVSAAPRADLGRLSATVTGRELRRFATEVAPIATDVLSAVAHRLADASDANLTAILERYLRSDSLVEPARLLDVDPAPLAFFPRAFVQPVAETLRSSAGDVEASASACPTCGRSPALSILRDQVDSRNARFLCCSLCAQEWRFPRLTCALCGETAAEALYHHVSEDASHVRVDECRSCRRYLKSIDLRQAGSAVPLVDEIASVELDLWASQQGLEKGCRNLLGL